MRRRTRRIKRRRSAQVLSFGFHVKLEGLRKHLTIVHPLLAVVKVPADPCRVVSVPQWVLETLDQRAEVLQGSEDARALIQERPVHVLPIDISQQSPSHYDQINDCDSKYSSRF